MNQSEQWLTRVELSEACGVNITKISEIIHTYDLPERTSRKDRRKRLYNLAQVQEHLEVLEERVRA